MTEGMLVGNAEPKRNDIQIREHRHHGQRERQPGARHAGGRERSERGTDQRVGEDRRHDSDHYRLSARATKPATNGSAAQVA